MAKNDNLTDFLTDVADAIRAKKGTTDKINPQNFSAEIASITTGGGEGDSDMPVIGDGKTYLYINIGHASLLDVAIRCSLNSSFYFSFVVDWGDGSETQTYTGYSTAGATHTYAKVGKYRISVASTYKIGTDVGHYSINPQLGVFRAAEIGPYVALNGASFRNCYNFKRIVIQNGVTFIGSYAFDYCQSLTSIEMPEGVTTIGSYAFRYCKSLMSVTIPSTVTSLGDRIFYECEALTSVVLPSKINSIPNEAFYGCDSLTSIEIPTTVTSIGDRAFSYSGLKTIVIPEGVTTIVNYAFETCESLTSVTMPSTVTSLGNYVFRYCSKLKTCDFSKHTSVPSLGTSAFNSVLSTCKIKVPAALLDTWKAATNWSAYASMIVSA